MARQWFNVITPVCGCESDVTKISSVIRKPRGKPRVVKESQVVRHYRERDNAHFWHWKDNEVLHV